MVKKQIFNLLGLAQRANKILSGENTIIAQKDLNNFYLMIIAQDASERTKRKFANKAQHNNLEFIFFGTKEELGLSLGKSPRTVLAISDKNFSQRIRELAGGGKL